MMQNDHYLNSRIPAEIAENLKELFPEHSGLSYEEVLLQQESFYESIQANSKNMGVSNRSELPKVEGESSQGGRVDSQLALDEAIAWSLQELGEEFEGLYVSEHSNTEPGSIEFSPIETPVRVVTRPIRQENVDPDNMTYEQLQLIGEAIGSENKGLSEGLILQLPTFKYKTTSLFSKKKQKDNEECVICCMSYISGVSIIPLPCTHQYHAECISRWLKLNKNCPVCQKEVQYVD